MSISFLSRRRQLLAALALAPLVPLPLRAAQPPLRARRALLGTSVDIVVAAPKGSDAAHHVERAFAEMQRLERLMSRFHADGELSHLNRAAGGYATAVSPELMAVLQAARQQSVQTQGAFNPVLGQLTAQADPGAVQLGDAQVQRLLAHARHAALELDARAGRARLLHPLAQLDLGGTAKLPILAAGLRCLNDAGLSGCLINGGGDVLASARADGQSWRIGIRDAWRPGQLIAVLPLHAGVVASSGDYERFITVNGQRMHHIIDPATGRSTRGLHGLTLVGSHVDQLNGFGPAAMVAGPNHAMRQLERWGVSEALLMGADASVQISAALRMRLLPPPGREQIRGLETA